MATYVVMIPPEAGREDKAHLVRDGFSFLAKGINPAVGHNRRGGIIATQSFAPNFLSGFRVHAGSQAALVIHHIKVIAN